MEKLWEKVILIMSNTNKDLDLIFQDLFGQIIANQNNDLRRNFEEFFSAALGNLSKDFKDSFNNITTKIDDFESYIQEEVELEETINKLFGKIDNLNDSNKLIKNLDEKLCELSSRFDMALKHYSDIENKLQLMQSDMAEYEVNLVNLLNNLKSRHFNTSKDLQNTITQIQDQMQKYLQYEKMKNKENTEKLNRIECRLRDNVENRLISYYELLHKDNELFHEDIGNNLKSIRIDGSNFYDNLYSDLLIIKNDTERNVDTLTGLIKHQQNNINIKLNYLYNLIKILLFVTSINLIMVIVICFYYYNNVI